MQTKTMYKLFSGTAMSLALAACGGGSGSALDNTKNGGSTSSAAAAAVTLRIGSGSGASFIPTKLLIGANSAAMFTNETTTITANIVDETGTLSSIPTAVTFSSSCLDAGTSTITGGKSITSVGGVVNAEYKVGTCFGDDNVKASITSNGKTASAFVNIPQINNKRIGSGSGTNFTAELLTASTGATTLFSGDTTKLSASIVDNQNAPVTQASQVTFTSPCLDAGLSTIAGGNTVASINGEAKADYKVGACNVDDKVTATIANGGGTTEATIDLPIDTRRLGTGFGSGFVSGALEVGIGAGTLSPGGVTKITAYIVNSKGDLITDPVNVTFSSPCLSAGNSAITGGNTVASVNGKAVATYTSQGCSGTGGVNGNPGIDAIKATTIFRNTELTASANISIKSDAAQTISFVDASPKLISIKGTGGLETSILRFQVLGQGGSPLSNICVNFNPSTTLGGLALVPSKCNPAGPETYGSTTDANGYASTTVQAGTIPTAVRVTATTSNGISTQSSDLAVTTGFPDQNSMSLSLSDRSPISWDIDGAESTVTIRMADAANNPVPDKTTVTFKTSGGSIEGSCPTDNGQCQVKWRSQSPRPISPNQVFFSDTLPFNIICPVVTDVTDPNIGTAFIDECRSGRVKILATAIGNESFRDGNGNGLYDDVTVDKFATHGVTVPSSPLPSAPDPTTDPYKDVCRPNNPVSSASLGDEKGCDDLPEAYLDTNLNYFHSQAEDIIDFNSNGAYDLPNGKYDGALCAGSAKASGMCTSNTVTVRDDVTLVMSCRTPFFQNNHLPGQPTTAVHLTPGNPASTIKMLLVDCNGNPMAAGTTVSVNSDALVNAKATVTPTSALTYSTNGTILTLTLTPDATKASSGEASLEIKSGGITTIVPIVVN